MAKIFLYVVLVYILIASIVCFIMYGVDKKRAEKDKWRIKEQTLLMTGFMGGGPGGIIGMLVFRHKTKHARFRIFFPFITIVEYSALNFVLIRYHDSLTYFLPIFN